MMNAFAAGVFLTMAFVHILPEAVETYNMSMQTESATEHEDHRLLMSNGSRILQEEEDHEDHEEEGELGHEEEVDGEHHEEGEEGHNHGVFPLPYLLFFLGYTVILLIDRVFSAHFGDAHGHGHGHGHSHAEHEEEEEEESAKLKKVE